LRNLFSPFSLGGKGLGIGGVFENENNPGVDTPTPTIWYREFFSTRWL